MKSSNIVIPVMAMAIILGGLGVWKAYAATSNNKATLNQELSQKLGISQDKVDTATSQIQAEREQERLDQMSTKLDKAVSDGVITADQKQKILDRMKEQQQKREQEQTEAQKWESDNGIDMSKLQSYIGGGFGGGKGGHGPGGLGMMW